MGKTVMNDAANGKVRALVSQANKALVERQYGEAEAVAESALAMDAQCGDAYLIQARAALAQGYFHQAVSLAGKAQHLLRAPDQATLTVAMGLSRLGEFTKAEKLFDRIVERQPDWVEARLQRAHNAIKQVDMDAARLDFFICTAFPESPGAAWYGYSYTKKFKDGDDDLQRLETDVQGRVEGKEDDFLAHYGLGKARGDVGRFSESLASYARANHLQSKYNQASGHQFQRREVLARARKLVVDYERAIGAMEPHSAGVPQGVLTLCGMPRVGKTLLQGNIARHAAVRSLSERNVLSTLAARVGINGTSLLVESLPALRWPQIAALAQVLPKCWEHEDGQFRWGVTTDPNGDRCVGAMAMLSSGARTVWCRRDPESTALAIFCRYFTSVRFSTGFEDIAVAQVLHNGLMAFWASQLPQRVHVVDYEQLVRNPDATVASVLGFMGLDADGLDDSSELADVSPDLLSSAGSVQVATRANPDFDTLKRDYAMALPQVRDAFAQAVELVWKRVPELRPYLPGVPDASTGAERQAV